MAEDNPADVAVLANDSDQTATASTVTGASDVLHGTTSAQRNGTVDDVPDANYAGDDGFGDSIADGHGGTAE